MSKKFSKFNYQLVDSTHKGYKEVLVTFEYKAKPCHYYSFIKEASNTSNQQYINAAKDEIQEMIKNGQLAKCAKRYLGYKIIEEDRAVTSTAGKVQGKPAKTRRKMPSFTPYALLCGLGVLLLAAGVVTFIRRMGIVQWPEYTLTPAEKFSAMIHLYVAIGFGVLALATLGAGIPLLIKKLKKK